VTIRLRVSLWYAALLALTFLLLASLLYYTLERELLLEVDRWLAPFGDHVLRSLDGQGDPSSPISAPDSALAPFGSPGVFVELLDPNGKPIARSPMLGGKTVPVTDSAFASAWWGSTSSLTTALDGQRYRAMLRPIPGQDEPRGFILVVHSLQEEDATLARLRLLLLAGGSLGLLLAVAGGWLIVHRGLRPIEEITQTARAIALSKGFSRRLQVGRSRDEVGRLAITFNEMLASLEEAHVAQRRFVADASHELRSPLTSIRSNIDILRRALDAPREDRAEALADVASEIERMSRLTTDLLLLAKADAGHRIEMARVDLDGLLIEVCHQMQSRANGVRLETVPVTPTVVMGSETWLKQLFVILLDNALKYTPAGGTITMSLENDGNSAMARVRDTGMGIAAQDIPHIFTRFYRADPARARDEGGSGLGLSIARWIVEEHGGEMSVQSEQGKGSCFTVRLPQL